MSLLRFLYSTSCVRNEIMGQLTLLGLRPKQALDVLSSKHVQKTLGHGTVFDGVFDAGDRAEGGDDLEKDERHAGMQWNLHALSMVTFSMSQGLTGMKSSWEPRVARNLYNLGL